MSENKKASRLYPVADALQVLGSLCKDTTLLQNKEYNLEVDDFVNPIHKVVFASINNLIKQGAKDIDDTVISNYMSTNQPSWYSIYNPTDSKMDFIENVKKLANPNNFIYHHTRLRKFSFLRDVLSKGFNINLLYDITEEDRELNNKFERTSLNDLVNDFSLAQLQIKESWIINSDDREYFRPDSYLNELLLELKKTPAFGYPFCSSLGVLTQITRGLRAGKFYIQSGSTGTGKTRWAVKLALNIACGFMYNTDTNKWEDIGEPLPALLISTELVKDELYTMCMAFVSGVEEHKILEGKMNSEEEERVLKAIEILKASQLHMEYIGDFDIESITNAIEKHIITNKVGYVFFDYIHMSASLLTSLKKTTGVSLREDQVISLCGTKFKELAQKYQIVFYTSTQLNRQAIENKNEINLNTIRGSFGLADKCDYLGIMVAPTTEEIEALKKLKFISEGVSVDEIPNLVTYVRKNRGGRLNNVRIYLNVNKGNMRSKFIALLDDDLRPISIEVDTFDVGVNERSEERLAWLNTKGNIAIQI